MFNLPNIYFVFAIVIWEGFLGDLVYASTFAEITKVETGDEREFALGAVTVSNSRVICIAGFVSLGPEMWLCRWQVARGRDYC